jgi:hypothetical protein
MSRDPEQGAAWLCQDCRIDWRFSAAGEVQIWRPIDAVPEVIPEPPPLPDLKTRDWSFFGARGAADISLEALAEQLEGELVKCEECGLVFAPATSALVEPPAAECPGCREQHLLEVLGDAHARIELLERDLIADSAVARVAARGENG